MLGLSKFLPKQLSIVSQCFSVSLRTSGQRNMFAPSYYGLDKFNRHAQYIGRQHARNADSIRSTIQQAIDKPDAKIFTEDLKVMLYLTKSDSDFQLLLKAINKYQTQEALAIFNFRFSTPLMRLAHTLGKTNECLELYLKDEPSFLHDSFRPGLILMIKLFEEKRFDDVLKVYKKLLTIRGAINEKATKSSSKNFFPNDVLKVVAETLMEKNDDEAVKQAKELIKFLKQENIILGNRSIACLFLLALQRNNTELAYELAGTETRRRTPVNQNLKIIALASMNRTKEAIGAANIVLQSINKDNYNNRVFFKQTLESLKEAVKKSEDSSLQTELDELVSKVSSGNLLMQNDLKEYATKLIEFRKFDDSQRGGEEEGRGNMRPRRTEDGGDDRPNRRRFNRAENDERRPPRQQQQDNDEPEADRTFSSSLRRQQKKFE